jgi:hypothetical protein
LDTIWAHSTKPKREITEKEMYQKEREKGKEIQIWKKEKGQIKQRNLRHSLLRTKLGPRSQQKKHYTFISTKN